jgi:hypothetical protein
MPGGGSGIDSPGLGAARGVGRGGLWTRHEHKKAKGVAGGGFGGGGAGNVHHEEVVVLFVDLSTGFECSGTATSIDRRPCIHLQEYGHCDPFSTHQHP